MAHRGLRRRVDIHLIDRDDGQSGWSGPACGGATTRPAVPLRARADRSGGARTSARHADGGPVSAASLPDGGAIIATNTPARAARVAWTDAAIGVAVPRRIRMIPSVDGIGQVGIGDSSRGVHIGVDAADGSERWLSSA